MIIHLIVGLIIKISFYNMSVFPEPYTHNESKIKVELDFSNHVTRSDLEKATGTGTSKVAKKVDLANLKLDLDKLYIGTLQIASISLK